MTTRTELERVDEGTLVELVLARDARAWRELVRRYEPMVRRRVRQVVARAAQTLGGRDAVDEIVGDYYLALLEHDMRRLARWAQSARTARLSTWLTLIAGQVAANHVRGRLRAERRTRAIANTVTCDWDTNGAVPFES
jgi:DNA-directed RNA polymerase specialized sigma24 family protein